MHCLLLALVFMARHGIKAAKLGGVYGTAFLWDSLLSSLYAFKFCSFSWLGLACRSEWILVVTGLA